MKTLILFFTVLFSMGALAGQLNDKLEVLKTVNIFVDNPEVVQKLKDNNVNVIDYSVREGEPGVNLYTFKLDRTCFCVPKPGTLKVTQDLRPSFADGPIEYSYTLQWEE